jgi:two-component system, LuxR family, response regulator FixJ
MRVNKNIFLVDDDETVCHVLSVFLESSGYSVRSFFSAETFLEETEDAAEGVILLDQHMTEGMSGLELQAELARHGIALPIIFITGQGDVQLSVKAMKAGAIDFLEKPLNNKDLLASIREAFARADDSKKDRDLFAECRQCLSSLTPRELEVMQHVVDGMSNRRVAELLGISERTIEVYRSRVMKKMRVESIMDLVRKCDMCLKDDKTLQLVYG